MPNTTPPAQEHKSSCKSKGLRRLLDEMRDELETLRSVTSLIDTFEFFLAEIIPSVQLEDNQEFYHDKIDNYETLLDEWHEFLKSKGLLKSQIDIATTTLKSQKDHLDQLINRCRQQLQAIEQIAIANCEIKEEGSATTPSSLSKSFAPYKDKLNEYLCLQRVLKNAKNLLAANPNSSTLVILFDHDMRLAEAHVAAIEKSLNIIALLKLDTEINQYHAQKAVKSKIVKIYQAVLAHIKKVISKKYQATPFIDDDSVMAFMNVTLTTTIKNKENELNAFTEENEAQLNKKIAELHKNIPDVQPEIITMLNTRYTSYQNPFTLYIAKPLTGRPWGNSQEILHDIAEQPRIPRNMEHRP